MTGIDNDIRVVYGMCCPPCCELLESYYYQLDPRSGTLPTPWEEGLLLLLKLKSGGA